MCLYAKKKKILPEKRTWLFKRTFYATWCVCVVAYTHARRIYKNWKLHSNYEKINDIFLSYTQKYFNKSTQKPPLYIERCEGCVINCVTSVTYFFRSKSSAVFLRKLRYHWHNTKIMYWKKLLNNKRRGKRSKNGRKRERSKKLICTERRNKAVVIIDSLNYPFCVM